MGGNLKSLHRISDPEVSGRI